MPFSFLFFFLFFVLCLPGVVALAEARRGLYVQIYGTRVGQLTVSGAGALDRFALVLESDDKVSALIAHLNAYKFTAVSMYNMWPVLADAGRTTRLRTVLRRLRSEVPTLEHVEAISDESPEMWRRFAVYQNNTADENAASERLDGFFTEIEFWNGQSSAEELLACIDAMRSVHRPVTRLPGVPLHYSVYIGASISNDTLIEVLVNSSSVTTFFIAAYVEYPSQASSALNSDTRTMRRIGRAAQKLATDQPGFTQAVGVIFSAEGVEYSAGPEYFMGDWLRANIAAQSVVARAEADTVGLINPPLPNALVFAGHQWYEYIFTGIYLENDTAVNSATTTESGTETSTDTTSTVTEATTETSTETTTTDDIVDGSTTTTTPLPSRVILSGGDAGKTHHSSWCSFAAAAASVLLLVIMS